MKTRILSSIVLVIIAAALVWGQFYVPILFTIAIALLCAVAAFELSNAVGLSKNMFYTGASILAAVAIVFLQNTKWIGLCLFVYTLVIFICQLRFHEQYKIQNVMVLYGMTLFVSFALGCSVTLRDMDKNTGIIMVLLGILTAWMSDVGGYFAGRFFGKKKLCPKISPKKTVAGVVGGFVLNLLVMLLAGWCSGLILNESVNILALVLLALGGTLISIVGDLSFSLIKREFGIKDYGKLIPGHGGILDRFDGVSFTLPFAYLLFSFLPLV